MQVAMVSAMTICDISQNVGGILTLVTPVCMVICFLIVLPFKSLENVVAYFALIANSFK